jgi:predicted ATPase
MRITRLELKNFRAFRHIVLENLPDFLVFVSPNGRGKSSILEAIAAAHELIIPYHQDHYQFNQNRQGRSVPIWPPHLSPPIKFGEHKAEILIEVQATGTETEYLANSNITEMTGTAKFTIEDRDHVSSIVPNDTIKRLFQYHNPKDGIGFVDYNRPVRFYLRQQLGDITSPFRDDRIKQTFMELHHPFSTHNKFSYLKSFIVGCEIDDLTYSRKTGHQRDSLELFREVFNLFFAPKKLIGCTKLEKGGEPQVVVESPFGSHDVDYLSDGEKEILHIFAHLYRFRDLDNIVLWDTPELHLNAALESRLYDALQRIVPRNQMWIASHSLEFINSVPLDNIFVIKQDGDSAIVERATGDEKRTRVAMYQEMGAQVGLQLVSSVVAFVEGKQAHSDKRILERLVAATVSGVNFVAGGSCENMLALGTRTNNLLTEACTNGDFLAIVDRDYRSDDDVAETISKYQGRLFMWEVHEIENLFLDPQVMFATLQYFDRLKPCETTSDIREQLISVARERREWIAADWVAWEFERRFQPPARRISGLDQKKSLHEYAARLKAKVNEATSANNIDDLYQSKLEEIDTIISEDAWLRRLPGTQLLRKYLERYPTLRPEDYVKVAVSTVLEQKIKIPEIERLKSVLRQAPCK